MKIGILRLNGIGDFILSTPAFRAIRKKHPNVKIHVYVLPHTEELARACPHFDEVRVFNIRSWGSHFIWPAEWMRKIFTYLNPSSWFYIIKILGSLRSENYDIILNFSPFTKLSPFITAFSGAKRRIGFKVGRWGRFLTDAVPPSTHVHETQSCLDLLKKLDISGHDRTTEIWFSPEDHDSVSSTLTTNGIHTPPIVLHIGSGAPARRWKPENFMILLTELSQRLDIPVVFIGSRFDLPVINDIIKGSGVKALNLAGRLTLTQTAALFNSSRLFIGGNSGPGHMAAAAQIPVISIFSSTEDPDIWKPWGERVEVITRKPACSPCRSHVCLRNDGYFCMDQIGPSEILEATIRVLEKTTT